MEWSGFKTWANPQQDQLATRKILTRESASPREAMDEQLPDDLILKKAIVENRVWIQPSCLLDTDRALVPTHHFKKNDIVLSITGAWLTTTMKKENPFPQGDGLFLQFQHNGHINMSVCLAMKKGRDIALYLHVGNKEDLGSCDKGFLWLNPEWQFSTSQNPCLVLRAASDMTPFSGELAVSLDGPPGPGSFEPSVT